MNILGFEITKRNKAARQNPILPHLLNRWEFGMAHAFGLATEQNYVSLLQAYRSWVYVCASKNATAVASVPMRLYVTKDEKQIAEGKTPRFKTKELTWTQKKNLL